MITRGVNQIKYSPLQYIIEIQKLYIEVKNREGIHLFTSFEIALFPVDSYPHAKHLLQG